MHILRRFVGATAHHCCGDAVNPSCAWASGALGGLTAGSPSACRGYNDSALATVTGAVPQALQANMFKAARDGLGTTLTVLAALGGAEVGVVDSPHTCHAIAQRNTTFPCCLHSLYCS